MGKTDIGTSAFWKENPDAVAELFNRFLFHKDIIDPKA